MTLTRRQVVELLEHHGLAPSRALGQNFVVDPNTVRRIARLAAIGPGDSVLEIGAGLGSLTLALVETGADITAVELDRGVVEVLRKVVAERAVRVVQGDALTLPWDEVLAGHDSWAVVANLPYNVATPLVLDLLQDVPRIERMLVMVQREVADRLAARPGSPSYGIPSVKVAYRATARVVGRVPPDVFLPRPRVESALVAIERLPEPATAADPIGMFALVHAGFGQRRKMLRRSLADLIPPHAFAAAGIRPEARAEELSIEQWGRLAETAANDPHDPHDPHGPSGRPE